MSRTLPARAIQRGFTLIEIMVVVTILAVLGVVVVPQILDRPNEARVVKAGQDIRAIEAALELYKLDNFDYPTTEQGLEALVELPSGDPVPPNWKDSGYLKRVPKDPWGRDYLYLSPGEVADIELYSLGNDGQQGGEGYDADITNLDL